MTWPAVCGPALSHPALADLLRLLLAAPLLEEWIVRAGLQAWLLQRSAFAGGGLGAPLLAAGAFSALHLGSGWQAAAMVFGPGLVLGLVYGRWRDWRLCALLHALFNAAAVGVCTSPFR
jgi:membrane protease YdiL (CAAX protease family)